MILLYKPAVGEERDLALAFLSRVKLAHRVLPDEAAGHTLGALMDGAEGDSGLAAEASAIIFSDDFTEEDVRRILDLIMETGLRFQVPILLTADNRDRRLADILEEITSQQAFIAALAHLQQLIDAVGRLNEKDYDPDKWSELKIAIADANDSLADLVGEDAEAAARARDEIVPRRDALARSMERLLSYRGPNQ